MEIDHNSIGLFLRHLLAAIDEKKRRRRKKSKTCKKKKKKFIPCPYNMTDGGDYIAFPSGEIDRLLSQTLFYFQFFWKKKKKLMQQSIEPSSLYPTSTILNISSSLIPIPPSVALPIVLYSLSLCLIIMIGTLEVFDEEEEALP